MIRLVEMLAEASVNIEELISTPLENELASLTDVEQLRSSSAEGFSLVSIEFSPDVTDTALEFYYSP